MKKTIQLLSLALACFIISSTIQAQPLCFLPHSTYATGTAPVGSTVGDFNEDGKLDIATSNQLGTVSIFLGTGTGTFGGANNFAAGSQPYGISCADFNSDTHLDLVVTNLTVAGQFAIYLGVGNGTFGAATSFTAGSQPREVAVGDFNNDGKKDLAVANSAPGTVSILLGTGTGLFGVANNILTGSFPSDVAIGDFNNDGNADVVVSNVTPGDVSILLGQGNGSFNFPVVNYTVGASPYGVAIADFNNDGKKDFCTANNADNTISVRLGTDTGTFGATATFPLAANLSPRGISTGDFNADGNMDIACSNFGDTSVSVLVGNGAGSFSAPHYFVVGFGGNYLSVADFNADGKKDIVTVNESTTNISVLLNDAPVVTYNAAAYDTLCATASAVALTGGTPAGGNYTGTGVSAGMFDPAVSGAGNFLITYTYTTTAGCSDTATQTIHVDVCAGINAANENVSFSIYPNPATNEINISSNEKNYSVTMFDELGRVVLSASSIQHRAFNIQNFASGLYFVEIKTNDNIVYRQKVVVVK